MRKLIPALIFPVVFLAALLVGCDLLTNETDAPSLKKVVVADSVSNLSETGGEKDTFTVGDTVYFAFFVTDSDLDVKQIMLLQKNGTQTIGPDAVNILEYHSESRVYTGSIKAEYAGNWTIQAYLVDAEGHESNAITKTIVVNERPPDPTYAVAFDSNGGSEIQTVAGLLSGAKITKPDDPAKPGFAFEGWHKDAQYTKLWDFENDVITDNITLYAKWQDTTYTVVFNSNGGTGLPPITGLLAGSKISKPSNPSKSGYAFDGWHKNIDLTESWDFNSDVVTSSMTLYAKWLDVAPGEVTITNCVLNSANNSVDIYFNTPSDIDLDHLIVYVNGNVYYNSIPKTYIGVYLYRILNGSVVTIKTVDAAGNISDGVYYTVDIPGLAFAPNIIQVVPSVDVIRKYPDRIDPPSISCSLSALADGSYIPINNPGDFELRYSTSKDGSEMLYTGPITIDQNWEFVEFRLYLAHEIFDWERVPIVSN
jgi:uncharacterized repeat protein (TIGR02543 family)